jgi:hypothetical protein
VNGIYDGSIIINSLFVKKNGDGSRHFVVVFFPVNVWWWWLWISLSSFFKRKEHLCFAAQSVDE